MLQGALFLLAGFLLALSVLIGNRELRARMSAWKSLADRFGLRYWSGDMGVSPGLEGSYHDRPVRVRLAVFPIGGTERLHTRVETTCKNPKALSFVADNQSGRVARTEGGALGLPVVSIGDERLEKIFELHASNADVARKVLDAKVRERLLWEERIRFEIDGHRVIVDALDAVEDEERLRLLLDLVVMVSDEVDGRTAKADKGHHH